MGGSTLPGKGSAAKRHRQSRERRMRNRIRRSSILTAKKSFMDAVRDKDTTEAESRYQFVTKMIDTAAGKGVYHKNTAARKKSRLNKVLKQLKQGSEA
ncbi:30S ribosomal protein S20 [Marispirochaeta sp.]|uniref:30S ribosomal protein S20 n=1 Tax=Marispirochaeta sp. TaxID=2038653 RepID=UPI0029C85388|nr:30S ribosomal protein S20 [Marispirochaeta sp.]